MRLWSIHPKFLDRQGLLGLWREGLLALKVLEGKTKGYKNHPQLERFKQTPDPAGYIAEYLEYVMVEGHLRGYNFDPGLVDHMVGRVDMNKKMYVNDRQLDYECDHLLKKLYDRDRERFNNFPFGINEVIHPMFYLVYGDIEPWEKVKTRK